MATRPPRGKSMKRFRYKLAAFASDYLILQVLEPAKQLQPGVIVSYVLCCLHFRHDDISRPAITRQYLSKTDNAEAYYQNHRKYAV